MGVELTSEIVQVAATALQSVPINARDDIYAISFWISDDEDDPRRPTLTIGYNTESQFRRSVSRASDAAEARWNFAFWLQNTLAEFGMGDSAQVVESWIRASGLWYSNEEEEADFDRCMAIGARITATFVGCVCEAVNRLHASGAVQAGLGKSIPIVIHELEYHHEIADQTERANPPGQAGDFVAWVRGLYQ
ncbi:MAG TPA: hypothetical protein P5081_18405 [Phycisphaerae bacterium]|nr:hypothetical protein [Phycisphaerae bacterium]HRW54845.1 hypothetical protein [Phycisphaerae bacterium]